jgi:hypothetical protein
MSEVQILSPRPIKNHHLRNLLLPGNRLVSGFCHGSAGVLSPHPFLGHLNRTFLFGCFPKARHTFHGTLQMGRGEVGVTLNQGGSGMPEQGRDSTVPVPIHRQSAGIGVSQGVPGNLFQFGGFDGRQKHASIEITRIQVSAHGLLGNTHVKRSPEGKLLRIAWASSS